MTAPTPITGEIRVNISNTVGQQSDVNLVQLNDGFLAMYLDSGSGIVVQRFDVAGNAVGASFTISSGGVYPTGVQLADGSVVLGYSGLGNLNMAHYDLSGTILSGPTSVVSGIFDPTFTLLDSGNILASWAAGDGQTRLQVFTPSGTAVSGELTTPNAAVGYTYNEYRPKVDTFSNGGYVVVSTDIFTNATSSVSIFDSSNSAYNMFVIEGRSNSATAVTVLSNDTFVIFHSVPGQAELYATIYNQNGTLAQAAQVVVPDTGLTFISDAVALSDGGFILVWEAAADQDGSASSVWARRFNALGQADGAAFLVNETTNGAQAARLNSVVELPNGDVAFSWWGEGTGDDQGAFVRVFDVSGNMPSSLAPVALTAEIRANTATLDYQGGANLIQLSDGFLAVWETNDGSQGLRAQKFDNAGNPVGGELTLITGIIGSPSGVQLADGTIVLAFYGASGVSIGRFDANGQRISGDIDVLLDANGVSPNVTLLANGRYAVSWHAVGDHAKAQIFNADGTAFTGVLTVNSTTSREVNPVIDAFSDGGVVIVSWDPFDGSGVHIQRYSPTGVAIGSTVQLAGDGGRDHGLAVLSNDSFVVVHGNPSDTGIYYTIFAQDGTILRQESLVSAQGSSFPQRVYDVVALRDGGFAVLWAESGGSDGSSNGIYLRRFTADGTPHGVAMLVNLTTAGSQTPTYNSLIELANGDLAVGWQGNGTGDDQGAFVRVFDLPADPSIVAAPQITSNGGGDSASVSVAENTAAVTTVIATDANLTTPTFSITGGADQALFQVNATTGALSFITAPNFESPTDVGANNGYEVIVTASDGSLTDSQTITVTVTNANETPVISSNGGGATASISVAENQTSVTTVVASDPDLTSVSYSITGGADQALFQINATTGALSFITAPNFESPSDAGGDNVYNVTVTASDDSLTDSQDIAVTVTNVAETPVISSNGGGAAAGISVAENQTSVTTVVASDPDLTSVTYSITGGADQALFQINATTGALSFITAPNFESPTDVGANNGYEVIVTASDGSLTDSQTLTVTVTDVAEDTIAPTLSITDNVTGTAIISTGNVQFQLNFSEVVTGLGLDDITVTGGVVVGLSLAPASSGDRYVLEVTPNANSTAPITVSVAAGAAQDGAGNLSGAGNATQAVDTIRPDAPPAPILADASNSGSISDLITNDTTPTFIISGEVGASALLLNSLGVVVGSAVIGISGQVSITAPALTNGTHSFTAAIKDAAGNTSIQSAAIVLIIDSAAPTLSTPVVEGVSGADTIVSGAELTGGVQIAVTVAGSPTQVTIGGIAATQSGAVWTASLTPVNGLNSYTVVATDAAGNSISATHTFTANTSTTPPNNNDTVTGGDGAETISTGIGNDVVILGGGDDRFEGGDGNDIAYGGDGRDYLEGGAGRDTMFGGAGHDTYIVDDTADLVLETTTISSRIDAGGVDTVMSSVTFSLDAYLGVRFVERLTLIGSSAINGTGNALDNILTGNSAANVLSGGLGNDTMLGGAGNDTFVVDAIGDRVFETTTTTSGIDAGGTDLVNSAISFSLAEGVGTSFVENLTLLGTASTTATGNALANMLTGNAGRNTLDGGAGDDTLNGLGGSDVMLGGAGNDVYVVDSAGDSVYETTATSSTLDAGGLDRVESAVSFNLSASIGLSFVENITLLGRANISATGNALDNVILGNAGVNTLFGGAGADTLNGNAGADVLLGGSGSDLYIVDNAGDRVLETTTTTSAIDAGGQDSVQSAVSFDLNAYLGVRFVEVLELTGTTNINGRGNGLQNLLQGNAGNNILDGGAGVDTMLGGAGNDTYIVENTADLVYETTTTTSGIDAGGVDTVSTAVSYNLGIGAGLQFVENLTLTGAAHVDGRGNGLANIITGNAGNNLLDGAAGADTMIGGAGNDFYVVNDAGDRVFETTTVTSTVNAGGTDAVQSLVSFSLNSSTGVQFVENLFLTGTSAVNGMGNALANTLIGNSAANSLNGGLGMDMLMGGGGADSFVFDTVLSAENLDHIFDFTSGLDQIHLDTNIFLGLNLGAQGAGAVSTDGTITADTRLIYESATGRVFYDADGAGGDEAVQFANLTPGLTLAADDFFVF